MYLAATVAGGEKKIQLHSQHGPCTLTTPTFVAVELGSVTLCAS